MVADDWLLLFTCVARMGELHPIYRSYPGYARRDLEAAIRAGRTRLRGQKPGQLDGLPTAIAMPITFRHRLDLSHDTLTERARHNLVGLLIRNVEIEWNSVAEYLRARAAESLPTEFSGRKQKPPSRPRSLSENKMRELVDRYFRREKDAERPTQKGFLEFAQREGIKLERQRARDVFNAKQREAGRAVARGRPKKSPS
jgi:hypothetical protein